MKKDPKIFLQHILESIDWIEQYVKKLSEEQFYKSTQIQDSVIRRLEIIGEAIKNLPDDFQENHQEIPWRQIAGMRDNLIHGYFGVDTELVWNTIMKDIPKLKEQIEKLLGEIEH